MRRQQAEAPNAWDAAARGPTAITITNAIGDVAAIINGTFDRVPEQRSQGAAPIYKRQGDADWKDWQRDVFLFLSSDNKWVVSDATQKDARNASGIALLTTAVVDGTLPHEAADHGWAVAIGGELVSHPALIVSSSAAEAEAAAQRAREAAETRRENADQVEMRQEQQREDAKARKLPWNKAAAGGPAAVVISGAVGDNAKYVNGWYDEVPAGRAPGGAPVYKRHAPTKNGSYVWLFLARNKKWYVSDASDAKARKASGWARTATAVDPEKPSLPPDAGAWDLAGLRVVAGINEVLVGEEHLDSHAGNALPSGWKRVMLDTAAFPGEFAFENLHTGSRTQRGDPVPTRPAVPAWADALFKACTAGDAAKARELLLGDTGATMAKFSTKYGSTPLHAAASLGKAACCKVLLEHPDIFVARDAVNNRDATALDLAEANKHAACVALLRQHGATSGRRRD